VTLSYNSAFLAKNERANIIHKDAFIPTIRSAAHDESRSWCPVSLLQEYIKTTRDLRPKDSSQLFVITKPPFCPATKATIARWISSVIETCYKAAHIDLPSAPKAHQVRAMAASSALYAGFSLKQVMEAASWTTENTFINCYLRDIAKDRVGARAVPFLGMPR
jgi:hypothetical protein